MFIYDPTKEMVIASIVCGAKQMTGSDMMGNWP